MPRTAGSRAFSAALAQERTSDLVGGMRPLRNPAIEVRVPSPSWTDWVKVGLMKEAEEARSFARRILRMAEQQTDTADRERLAIYAAHLDEYASNLEEQASSPEPRLPECGKPI